ncbi:hypothetical protein FDUTEX481_00807 [Tolypothrix sp. PCC 7601]|nr:hypothetical protein FDUTEX481_00807 [Tolypothrix sp. PCC 7601]BAY92129.1 hypothetical protein NIES3275_41610 [Microchaete diplosiphon NIES-3275]
MLRLLINQDAWVKLISVLIQEARRIGGFSPKPPIGGRLRPPNPLQNDCSVLLLSN